MPEIPFPRGVRDLLPNEALFKNELLKRVESVFQLFGFATIDTPSFESLNVLKAKNAIGEDTKLIYELKDENLGLRYDLTVSLARYMAMHQELPMPFKRYQIGKVWRGEEPQRLRYREITQADADIIGGVKALADAESIAVGAYALESIGFDYAVEINDRMLMERIFSKLGVGVESFIGAARAIDKLEKLGMDKVYAALSDLGIDGDAVDGIMRLARLDGSNEDKLSYVEKLLGDAETTKNLKDILAALAKYNLHGSIVVDFSLMRGLDYYTGTVFEFKERNDLHGPSIAGGGRYDNLIGMFAGRTMPAVGVSLGISRILELLNYSASTKYGYAKVFVAYVNERNYGHALKVTNAFRSKRIATEINIASRNLSNQLAHANSLKAKYAVIIGDTEEKAGNLKLHDLASGEEQTLGIDEAVTFINGN
jgi:histidyl-tRNA synthetase